MSTPTIDTITMAVFLGFWPIWLGWELALLWWRAKYEQSLRPKTISMVARDIAWKATTLVYLWTGSCSHWFWNGPTPTTVPGGILFWLIPVGLLVGDVLEWKRPAGFRPWYRNPVLWMVLGTLAGRFLFPQTAG